MRMNEYIKLGVDGDTDARGRERAAEMLEMLGLTEKFEVKFVIDNGLKVTPRFEAFCKPRPFAF